MNTILWWVLTVIAIASSAIGVVLMTYWGKVIYYSIPDCECKELKRQAWVLLLFVLTTFCFMCLFDWKP